MLWHRRYGHIGEQSLKGHVGGNLVESFDYNYSGDLDFCESCVGEKQYRNPFESSERQTGDLFVLVHSEVCGENK